MLDKLIENKVIVDWVFAKEYTFSSPIAVTNVVMKGYVSGNEYLIDANGKKLKDYNI